ncbi:MAG: hypothetical protein U5N56_01835 [Candidatus Marinimicrobia bacterium]|nr:hypothetical protein [Candidatus Neomarinimicrobiota bacterium]
MLHHLLNAEDRKADKVVNSFISAYKNQMENIEDITRISDKTTYYEKWSGKAGGRTYKNRMEKQVDGKKRITVYDGEKYMIKDPESGEIIKRKAEHDPLIFYEYLRSLEPEYAGTATIDGNRTHVLEVKDADLGEIRDPAGNAILFSKTEDLSTENVNTDDAVVKRKILYRCR